MKKEEDAPYKFNSLSDVHRAFGLPKPLHPLISLIDNEKNPVELTKLRHSHVLTFYKIALKGKLSGKLRYGQDYYDFDEGGLLFAAPGQIIGNNHDTLTADCSMYTLLIHPDFLVNYPLSKKIRQYGFFSYSANEALHLSDQEKEVILSIFDIMNRELHQ
jgi:AraC family transcriptional activator of pobA